MITFANAGSPPIIICDLEGHCRIPSLVDPPVGLPFVESYRSETIQLSVGDVFMLYTDGLYEARNSEGEEFGLDKLPSLLSRYRSRPTQRMPERIVRDVSRFSAGRIFDDIALLVFRVTA